MGFSQLSTKQEVNILLNTISWVHTDTMNISGEKNVSTKYCFSFKLNIYILNLSTMVENDTRSHEIKPKAAVSNLDKFSFKVLKYLIQFTGD